SLSDPEVRVCFERIGDASNGRPGLSPAADLSIPRALYTDFCASQQRYCDAERKICRPSRPAPRSMLGLGRVHGSTRHGLSELARLLGEDPHLLLHMLGVQLHYLRHVLRLQQARRVVERRLDVRLGEVNSLGAELLRARLGCCALALELVGGLLSRAHEAIERLACLAKAGLGHVLHVLWNLEVLRHVEAIAAIV